MREKRQGERQRFGFDRGEEIMRVKEERGEKRDGQIDRQDLYLEVHPATQQLGTDQDPRRP